MQRSQSQDQSSQHRRDAKEESGLPSVEAQQKARLKNEFSKAVASFSQHMPLLMHGSGDVAPSDVNPESVRLLSTLTAQYVGNLLDAALDSNAMLRNGDNAVEDFNPVPPPPFPRSRTPAIPPPPNSPYKKRKRARASDEYWDEPLAEPIIRPKQEGPNNRQQQRTINEENPDTWVGVAGADMFEESRARSAYVRNALSTQSFIFPICHDAYAYGRVTEVLSANRGMEPVLMDSVLMETVGTEGKRKHAPTAKKKKKESGSTSDPEDEDEDNAQEESDEEGPSWPGVGTYLPVPDNMEADGGTKSPSH